VGDGLNTSGIRFNSSAPVKQSTAAAKFDYLLNAKHTVYARLNYQNDISVGTSRFPDTPQVTTWAHPRGLSAGDTWTVTPNIVNSFRYGITRDAITTGGDSDQNSVNFRFIFQPFNYSRGRIRTTPVHNFVDDISINRGRHTLQAGINFRLITNSRNAFTSSYDTLVTNPSFYEGSGDSVYLDASGNNIFPNLASRSAINARDAITAVVGRLSQYGANLVYDRTGKVQANGTGVARKFKTDEYEAYIQDSWRVTTKLTVTGGLRWSTGTPVYEADGYQVSPTTSLTDYFNQRVAGSAAGTPYNNLLTLDYSGKANNKPGFYSQDWNNFAPSASVAWQFAKKMVIRGGYRLTYDRIGSALAVNFDALNAIGFTSAASISANTFNLSTNLAPQFTGLSQDVRGLPKLIIPPTLAFPAESRLAPRGINVYLGRPRRRAM